MLDHLPERDRAAVRRRLRAAWALDDHDRALDRLRVLADELARTAPRRRRVAARGHRGDAHRHPPRRARPAQAHARLDEPVRVDDRDRPPHQPQRQALAVRRHVPALDRRRHARSRDASSARIIGHRDLAKLAVAVERDVAAKRAADTSPATPFTRPSRPRRRRSPLHPPEIIHSQDRRHEVPRRAGHPLIASAHRAFGVIPCRVTAASGATASCTPAGSPSTRSGYTDGVACSFMARTPLKTGMWRRRRRLQGLPRSPALSLGARAAIEARRKRSRSSGSRSAAH